MFKDTITNTVTSTGLRWNPGTDSWYLTRKSLRNLGYYSQPLHTEAFYSKAFHSTQSFPMMPSHIAALRHTFFEIWKTYFDEEG